MIFKVENFQFCLFNEWEFHGIPYKVMGCSESKILPLKGQKAPWDWRLFEMISVN
jgi:hypothetical protein